MYRINLDNDGDAQTDVAFTFTFSEPVNGVQTGTVHYASGAQAREPGPAGEELTAAVPVSVDATVQPVETGGIRVFAGARSEPFFADIEGALHGFQWTGHDDFAGNNVMSIVLEVPDDMLGGGPAIGVWATISLPQDGAFRQMDRGGNPTINPFITPDGEKDLYNSRQPVDDVINYLGAWSTVLEKGGYPPGRGQAGGPQVPARHPAVRPQQARRLPRPADPLTVNPGIGPAGRCAQLIGEPGRSPPALRWTALFLA